jgi:hypothetical protein
MRKRPTPRQWLVIALCVLPLSLLVLQVPGYLVEHHLREVCLSTAHPLERDRCD